MPYTMLKKNKRVNTYYCGAGDAEVECVWTSSSKNPSAACSLMNEHILLADDAPYHSPCYLDCKTLEDDSDTPRLYNQKKIYRNRIRIE